STSVKQPWVFRYETRKGLPVAGAQRFNHCYRFGIYRRYVGFIGQCIRPVRPLIDPSLDRVDLVGTQRTLGRHLQPKVVPDQPEIEEAVFTATRNDPAGTSPEDGTSAVQTQSVYLLRCAMTTDTVLPEYGQHITAEIDFDGSLCV